MCHHDIADNSGGRLVAPQHLQTAEAAGGLEGEMLAQGEESAVLGSSDLLQKCLGSAKNTEPTV